MHGDLFLASLGICTDMDPEPRNEGRMVYLECGFVACFFPCTIPPKICRPLFFLYPWYRFEKSKRRRGLSPISWVLFANGANPHGSEEHEEMENKNTK